MQFKLQETPADPSPVNVRVEIGVGGAAVLYAADVAVAVLSAVDGCLFPVYQTRERKRKLQEAGIPALNDRIKVRTAV